MRCDRQDGPAGLCPECTRRFIVEADRPDGEMEFFCFETEAAAREAFDRIERTNEYGGLRFKPKSAILMHPKEEGEA